MLQNGEAVLRLGGHHLPALSDTDVALLALRLDGARAQEIADLTHRAKRTVTAQLERIESLICEPLGFTRDHLITGFWLREHLYCDRCRLGRLQEMLQEGLAVAVLLTGTVEDARNRKAGMQFGVYQCGSLNIQSYDLVAQDWYWTSGKADHQLYEGFSYTQVTTYHP